MSLTLISTLSLCTVNCKSAISDHLFIRWHDDPTHSISSQRLGSINVWWPNTQRFLITNQLWYNVLINVLVYTVTGCYCRVIDIAHRCHSTSLIDFMIVLLNCPLFHMLVTRVVKSFVTSLLPLSLCCTDHFFFSAPLWNDRFPCLCVITSYKLDDM